MGELKILELVAENVKNLKAIRIKADPNVNVLEGKIGAGKSATLDCMLSALTGKKIKDIIREGQDKAKINLDMGDYIVNKVFTKAGERLEVLSPEGAKYPSPQTLLNKIYGKLGFDPLAFSKMDKKQQYELLKQLVGLDFSSLDNKRIEHYNIRTSKNKDIKEAETMFKTLTFNFDVPLNEISINDKLTELEQLDEQQKNYKQLIDDKEAVREKIDNIDNIISNKEKEVEELKEKIKNLEIDIVKCKEEKENKNKEYFSILIPSDPSSKIQQLKEEMKTIEATNIMIRENKKYEETKKKVDNLQQLIKDLTTKIEEIDSEKLKQIRECEYPIEGLSIKDETVLFNGRPFANLSTGEKILVSTSIAMALNPKLKIILIREGALLDKEGLEAITKAAKDKDYQLWIEKTSDEKTVGLYIKDGEIV